MFRDARARERSAACRPCELLVRIDWADDLPHGTVQDAARTHDAIAFAGWIELAEAIRRLTGEVATQGEK